MPTLLSINGIPISFGGAVWSWPDAGVVAAPTVSTGASITGLTTPGATLTAVDATFTGTGVTVTRSWRKNGTATGATGTTYSDTADGDSIVLRVTGTNAGGSVYDDSDAFVVAAESGFAYTWPVAVDESADESGFRGKVRTPAGAGSYTTAWGMTAPETGIGTTLDAVTTYHPYDTEFGALIVAYNGSGESAITYPEFVFRTAPAGTITDLAATALTPASIGLTWTTETPPTWGGFRVQSGDDGIAWETIGTVLTEDGIEDAGLYSFAYTHSGLPEVTQKYYRLIPFNTNPNIGLSVRADSEAAASNTDSATTTSSGYVVRADFENGTTENGIADYFDLFGSGVYFDNSEFLVHSGKCVKLDASSYIIRGFTATDTMGAFQAGRFNSATAAIFLFELFNVYMDGDAIQIRDASYASVASQSLTPGVGHYPGSPVRYYWVDWDGVAGTVTAIIASTPTKPTPDTSNSVTWTNAALIGTVEQYATVGPAYVDYIRVAPTEILSNPL